MSLATRCSTCGTAFRIVQDQLKVSEGWVRCGRCNAVFNALEGLFDLGRDAPADWSESAHADDAAASAPLAKSSAAEEALWELVARGLVTGDGFASLRSLLADPDKQRGRRDRSPHRGYPRLHRGELPAHHASGRWSLLAAEAPAVTVDGDGAFGCLEALHLAEDRDLVFEARILFAHPVEHA